MDILYIVGSGSNWNNNELKYSLRSIEKNCKNIDRVMIIGEKPKFLNDKIEYAYCYDRYGPVLAHKNIYYKIQYAIKVFHLDHFLISSDDHFYIKPTDFNNYPIYYRNLEIPSVVPEGIRANSYWYSMFETRKFLLKKGLPIYQTNPHANTHIDANLWRDNISLFAEAQLLKHGGETNLIMGNLMIANGIVPEPIEDKKIFNLNGEEDFYNRIKNVHVFSMADSALKSGMDKRLQELFPDKSSYEK